MNLGKILAAPGTGVSRATIWAAKRGSLASMALALFLAFGVGVVLERGAHALSTTLGVPDNFTVACATTATKIQGNAGKQRSYRCMNTGSTEVYVGDSAVTTSDGSPYCTTAANCPDGAAWGGDLAFEYCIVASGTQAIRCRSGAF